jgi:hypothetical protein
MSYDLRVVDENDAWFAIHVFALVLREIQWIAVCSRQA